MTAVLCWLNNECDKKVLWCISDSRISQQCSRGEQASPLTDRCPKIFSIPIKISKNIESEKNEICSVGFAYAGSTLVGMSTKEILSRLLSNLVESSFVNNSGISVSIENIPENLKLPSFSEIADMASKIATKIIYDVGQYQPNVSSQMAVFGYCKKQEKYVAYKISQSLINPAEVIVKEVAVCEGEILHIGNKEHEITATIKSLMSGNSLLQREPAIALSRFISNVDVPKIGGYTQCIISTHLGFCEFQMFDQNLNQPSYFNLDIEFDIPYLGAYQAMLPAISLE